MAILSDFIRVYIVHTLAQISLLKKSPINLWVTMAVQGTYYLAQFLFWIGIKGTANGMLADSVLLAFLVTLGIVDNAYLLFFGDGSGNLQKRIMTASLEPVLLMPRHPLTTFVFFYVNFGHLPGLVISLGAWLWYLWQFNVGWVMACAHLFSMMIGVAILNGISFMYRMSTFWTAAIVSVRNSNPSYKIMVRPLKSFEGSLRLVLLTIFPALFITGVPAELLVGARPMNWLGYGVLAALLVWSGVYFTWRQGIRRYQLKAN